MGAKNGKILGRPGQKIMKNIENGSFGALRAPFEPIYSASGVKKTRPVTFLRSPDLKTLLKE